MQIDNILDEEFVSYMKQFPKELYANGVVTQYNRGFIVCIKGEYVDRIKIIISGRVHATNDVMDGIPHHVSSLGRLNIMGDLGVLTGNMVYTLTTTAITPVVCFEIPTRDFVSVCNTDITSLKHFSVNLLRIMFKTSSDSGRLIHMDAYNRLKYFLVEYYHQHTQGGDVTIKMNRIGVAAATGLSERTVNRTIKQLTIDGYIDVIRGKIIISELQFNCLEDELTTDR